LGILNNTLPYLTHLKSLKISNNNAYIFGSRQCNIESTTIAYKSDSFLPILIFIMSCSLGPNCTEDNNWLLSALEGVNSFDFALISQFLLVKPFNLSTVRWKYTNIVIIFRQPVHQYLNAVSLNRIVVRLLREYLWAWINMKHKECFWHCFWLWVHLIAICQQTVVERVTDDSADVGMHAILNFKHANRVLWFH